MSTFCIGPFAASGPIQYTYIIDIVAGLGKKDSNLDYVPSDISILSNTMISWLNDDPE
jgi:hypothetical protein